MFKASVLGRHAEGTGSLFVNAPFQPSRPQTSRLEAAEKTEREAWTHLSVARGAEELPTVRALAEGLEQTAISARWAWEKLQEVLRPSPPNFARNLSVCCVSRRRMFQMKVDNTRIFGRGRL